MTTKLRPFLNIATVAKDASELVINSAVSGPILAFLPQPAVPAPIPKIGASLGNLK